MPDPDQEQGDSPKEDPAVQHTAQDRGAGLTGLPANVADHSFTCARLDPETFQVVKFEGKEFISRPYKFTITLRSTDPAIGAAGVVGQPAVLHTSRGAEAVPFCGIVTALDQTGRSAHHFYYQAALEPRLIRLQKATHSRIFQHQSVPGIITEVLGGTGLRGGDVRFELTGAYPQREYCVQHRETDLAFISRLMEHEGICYFFEHEAESGETLVIADHRSAHSMIAEPTEVLYRRSAGLVRGRVETIEELTLTMQMTAGSVALKDYNERAPQTELSAHEEIEGQEASERYEYGDHYGDIGRGRRLAKVRAEEIACRRRTIKGTSDCAGLRPGHCFTLAGHFRSDANDDYLITKVRHKGLQGRAMNTGSTSGDGAPTAQTTDGHGQTTYGNTFWGIPARVPFRPERKTPVPKVKGLMVARTETAGGPYAYLDEEGRYRAKMDFDRSDTTDGRASLPIRMAQAYSGPGYGIHFPNHAGTEMVWACINGDPDRPVALGTVPNPSQSSPVTSGNRMENVIRTWSGSELVFDDTQDEEEIRLSTPDRHRLLMSDKKDRAEIITTGKHSLSMDDRNENVQIESAAGHLARFDDREQRFTLQSEEEHRFQIDDKNENITLEDQESQNRLTIDIKSDVIDVVSEEGSITIAALEGQVNLEAKEMGWTATGGMTFASKNTTSEVQGEHSVRARDVRVEAGNRVAWSAGTAAELIGGTSVTTSGGTNYIKGGRVNIDRGGASGDRGRSSTRRRSAGHSGSGRSGGRGAAGGSASGAFGGGGAAGGGAGSGSSAGGVTARRGGGTATVQRRAAGAGRAEAEDVSPPEDGLWHEVLFVPSTETFYFLDEAGARRLDEQEKKLNGPMQRLLEAEVAARRQGTAAAQQQLEKARRDLEKELEPLVSGAGQGVTFTEAVRLGGKRWSYVLDPEMGSGWVVPERFFRRDHQSMDRNIYTWTRRGKDGSRVLDTRRMRETTRRAFKKLYEERTGVFEYELAGVDGSGMLPLSKVVPEALDGWANWLEKEAERLSRDAQWDEAFGKVGPGHRVSVDAEAQFARYAYGASVEAGWQPARRYLGAQAKAEASMSLAEGKFAVNMYSPQDEGIDLAVVSAVLGQVRSRLELALTAWAGGTVSLAGELGFHVPGGGKPTQVKGLSPSASKRGGGKVDGLEAGAEAFAGVEAGGSLKGAFEWKSPEKRTWGAFASLSAGVAGNLGIGGKASVVCGVRNGKFEVGAEAQLVYGAGGKGTIVGAVDGNTIAEFVPFVYHQLRAINYEKLTGAVTDGAVHIEEEAWRVLSALVAQHVVEGVKLPVLLAEQTITNLREWWMNHAYEGSRFETQRLARRVRNTDEMTLRLSPPDAKGRVLALLLQSKDLWLYAEEPEEEAALRIVEQIQTKREFEEVCQRITLDGSTYTDWRRGEAKLQAFFDYGDRDDYAGQRRRIATQGIYQRLPYRVEPHSPTEKTIRI